MRKILSLCVFMLLLAGTLPAQIPETPAGRQFSAWLDSFNTGDRAAMLAFFEQNGLERLVDQSVTIYANSGGYEVLDVEESSDTRIVVAARERGPLEAFVSIVVGVEAAPPYRMNTILIRPGQPPAGMEPARLTESEADAARQGAPFRQFAAWLEAFNAGDRDGIARFIDANYPSANVDGQMNFRERTGGFDLRLLERATDVTLVGLVEERNSDQFARFSLVVEPDEPHRITRFGITAIPRPAEFPVARLSEAEVVPALRERLERDAQDDRFAGAVLLARGDQILFSGAHGSADREQDLPNTLDTRFRLGSMNKMFTAVAVLQLVQDGQVRLDDPVGVYVTDYPNADVASRVTIHHLLTHTGGTGDIFGPDFTANRLDLRTHDDYVALYGDRPPAFEPGSRYAYSNYGMVLLGVVIERVTGQSYYDYVAEHIYRPAGMTRTGSEPESEAVPGRSIGYMRAPAGGGWTPNTDTLPYRGMAAGGGYSTVGDLLKFANALMGHVLLDEEHTAMLITGKVEIGGGRMYAYGFEDQRVDGAGAVGHSGGAPGMSGDLRIYPDSGYVVAVLANIDPPAAPQVSAFLDLRLPR